MFIIARQSNKIGKPIKVKEMPIYEYECNNCKTKFETIVSISSKDNVACEKCGSEDTRKLISAMGIKISSTSDSISGCQPRGGFS